MKKPELIDSYFQAADIHAEKHVGPAGILSFIVALLFFIAHGLNAWLLFFKNMPFSMALIIHIALAVVAGVLARVFVRSRRNSRFLLLLFITTTTMGVFGAAGTLLSVMLHHWYMRFAQPFAEWFSSIFPTSDVTDAQHVYDDIMVGRDESSKPYSVIPFVDVLWYGSEAQKRMALGKMTSRFNPSFAPAFKKALNDNSNSIRVQAATAISKIENQFVSRLMQLTELYDNHPEDATVVLALASHYDDYAFTGILDIDRERNNREQALKYYMRYLEMKPSDTDVHARIGRLMMRNGEAARAADWMKQSLQLGHRSQPLLMWYAEALYACQRYEELRHFSRETKWQSGGDTLQPWLLETINFWEAAGGLV